ncbi:hypothetical protein RJ640_014415 [Escallonia rubra]|uniref:Membrane protein insertion efficiency factor n=1 Tax=Escallonia rubra TaxID=112253 RepID=A0AA88QPP6_9ASTE|nr:hypothetical protein RJ640_014415 [Escallonia rubra]
MHAVMFSFLYLIKLAVEYLSDGEVNNLGVKAALSMLKFYKREISPVMPNSCRYLPTCSEYSMIAYKKYGVVKGTVLTAWRLCRCNPLAHKLEMLYNFQVALGLILQDGSMRQVHRSNESIKRRGMKVEFFFKDIANSTLEELL